MLTVLLVVEGVDRISTVKQEIFARAIFALSSVIKFCENILLHFLLLVYNQSIEQRNICALNFCDRPKILKNAKISCSTVIIEQLSDHYSTFMSTQQNSK